ncbi:hypothetical protein CPB83DRAFT_838084 [Crepidotus variabilis]|uniref:FAD-binding domain-containing protein n=1 Tax=Crepidotus variabilis TaxID=179855 RepID=A0A9P6JM79_9AGAR|nr:hypothetical protein CPB83DRAFT_838084 [Crepidotus variabilis]
MDNLSPCLKPIVTRDKGQKCSPRTLKVLKPLGLWKKVAQFWLPVPKIALYGLPGGTEVIEEAEMISTVDATPDIPHPNVIFLGQNHLQAMLAEAIINLGGVIDRGIELKNLQQSKDSVQVTLVDVKQGGLKEASYEYIACMDGGEGIVRKALDIPFVGETRENTQIVFGDFYMKGLGNDRVHIWGDILKKGLLAKATETPGLFSLIIGGDIKSYINSSNRMEKFNIRMAPQFSKGRVFIGGGRPTGGQTLAVKDGSSNPNSFARGGKLNQLGVNYRTSRTVVDDGEPIEAVSGYGGPDGGPVRAGDRAPDASGLVRVGTDEPARLFEIFDSRLHTVVIFADRLTEELIVTFTLFTKYSPEVVRFVVVRWFKITSPQFWIFWCTKIEMVTLTRLTTLGMIPARVSLCDLMDLLGKVTDYSKCRKLL